jgi:hypothetical protein
MSASTLNHNSCRELHYTRSIKLDDRTSLILVGQLKKSENDVKYDHFLEKHCIVDRDN